MWQPLRRLTLAAASVLLVLAAQATAAGQTTSSVYTVGSLTVLGVDTGGLVLQKNRTVTVTATGSVCPGTGFCATPHGYPSIDTTTSAFAVSCFPARPRTGSSRRSGVGPGRTSAAVRRR